MSKMNVFTRGDSCRPPGTTTPRALILFIAIILSLVTLPATAQNGTNSTYDCLKDQVCGNITVQYPFRIANDNQAKTYCDTFNATYFDLNCDSDSLYLPSGVASYSTPDSKIMNHLALRITTIRNDSVVVDVTDLKASLSYNDSYGTCNNASGLYELSLGRFPRPYFIAEDNVAATFGCDVYSLDFSTGYDTVGNMSHFLVGGCAVICPGDDQFNPDCGNRSCCFSAIDLNSAPRFVSYSVWNLGLSSSSSSATSDCSSSFYTSFLHREFSDFDNYIYRIKLSWALPSESLASELAITTTTADFNASDSALIDNLVSLLQGSADYECSANATPIIVPGVPGYLCSCDPGFEGNGYSKGDPCKDINECGDPTLNQCISGTSTCHNTIGNYICKCDSMFHVGDGRRDGTSCSFSSKARTAFAITGVLVFMGLVVGCMLLAGLCWRSSLKKKYFEQNGGGQLQQYIAATGGRASMTFFKAEELKAATNNYADDMKLGTGGYGTVYKGRLQDGREVAIKKANATGGDEQFVNEMMIVTQLNHRNIVRLLGCCLETSTPLLAYEFVSNGNLAENLSSNKPMDWAQRLRVATQTAEALAYLHAAASPPILHRDVKTANVLLDENLDAKVADFGVSRLVLNGEEHVSTAVQGTIGYLDPEYFQTLQLTDKSDVYSFGVVLVELITGMKPVDSRSREARFANLALLFIERMQQGSNFDDLIDIRLGIRHGQLPSDYTHRLRTSIMAVANLAFHCLALRGCERPSMSEVVDELRQITRNFYAKDVDYDNYINYNESSSLLQQTPNRVPQAGAVVQSADAQFFVASASQSLASVENLNLHVRPHPR